MKQLGNTATGGKAFTVKSKTFITHPIRIFDPNLDFSMQLNSKPDSWEVHKETGFDDYEIVFKAKTEEECIEFLKAYDN